MILHPEVMPPSQQNMLRQLGPIASARGFYLAGGTALAIQLGHGARWISTGSLLRLSTLSLYPVI
jgi:hypothetical protein